MTEALQQQSKLVALARGLAVQGAEHADVKAGLAAADGVKGLVIADENALVEVNDRGASVTKALKALKRAEDEVLAIPKDMVAAVRGVTAPLRAQLEAARDALDDAQRDWNRRQREAAAAAERERLAKIAEADRLEREREAEATRAAFEGRELETPAEDLPPPPEAPPIVAPRALVRTSSGASTSVKRLSCELVNPHECDVAWLALSPPTAPVAWYEMEMKRGDAAKPGIGRENGIVVRGVRFFYAESISRSTR
jgi:hypothetical protein